MHEQVRKLLELPKVEQRSEEWLEQRKKYLTASDFASAIGRNKHRSSKQLLLDKCGYGSGFTGNEITEWGQIHEDPAVELYSRIKGKKVYTFGLIPHPTIEFLAGSPDGITEDGILLEIKCPTQREIKAGIVQEYYMPQIQLNLEICNLELADFIEYKPCCLKEKWGGPLAEPQIHIVRVKRDREWFESVYSAATDFWSEVKRYREIGIDNHPVVVEKKKREKEKAKTIDLDDLIGGPQFIDDPDSD